MDSSTTFPDKEQRQNYYVKNKDTYVKLGVTSILPELGRQRQEDNYKFRGSLGYKLSFRSQCYMGKQSQDKANKIIPRILSSLPLEN